MTHKENDNRIYIPNSHLTPNIIADHWLKIMTSNDAKIMFVLLRKTFGWNKFIDSISLKQIIDMTLLSKSSVIRSLEHLIEIGLIKKIMKKNPTDGRQDCNEYEIIIHEINEVETRKIKNLNRGSTTQTQGSTTQTLALGEAVPHRHRVVPPVDRQSNIVKDSVIKKTMSTISDEKPTDPKSEEKTLEKTMPFKKEYVDASRKYKLKADHIIIFEWLKSQNIDTDDSTLAFWSKTYLLGRIQEVHRYAKKHSTQSVGAYMQQLLKGKIKVPSDRMLENQTLSVDYKNANEWVELEIGDKYVTCEIGGHMKEIPLDYEPFAFIDTLTKLHQLFESYQEK